MDCSISTVVGKGLFFPPQSAVEADSSTNLSRVFSTTARLKMQFCLFLLPSTALGREENPLDKYYTEGRREYQSTGNHLPHHLLPRIIWNISPG